MSLSRFTFVVSTMSTFGSLWAMLARVVARDVFAWFVVLFSFVVMGLSAIYATSAATEGRHT